MGCIIRFVCIFKTFPFDYQYITVFDVCIGLN